MSTRTRIDEVNHPEETIWPALVVGSAIPVALLLTWAAIEILDHSGILRALFELPLRP